ncbi:diguanylate cyclase, partial [bacterium]|nr:diguanylate cyclase [bacterium]
MAGNDIKLQNISNFFKDPIKESDGSLLGYKVSEEDAGKLNDLLIKLNERKKNLKEAQRLANIGHWELDLVHHSLYWSDEVYRIFGLEPQEFGATYESFLKHIHPDDHDLVNNAYMNSVADKSSYRIVHRVLTKQNELKYVEERCIHKLDDNGNVVRSIGTVHDITKTVIYEKELELASNVFKYSTDAIVITDAENKIVSVNNAYEKLTQYSAHEVLGKDPKILSSGWGDKEFYQTMWKGIVEDGFWQSEIWDRKKDGTLYAAFQSIVAVRDKENKIVNYIAISHDITEMKNREKTIQQLAFYDFLTKLPNRKLFEQEVESFIKSSHYSNKTFAMLFLDLDNFKWVNDSLGHRFGDKVLVEVSKKISSAISQDCIAARLGGDEFVILAPYEKSLSISQLASKIIEDVRVPLVVEGKEINVGWSIGISLFPENATSYTLLMQNADTAMYAAKAKGKNNFKFFADEMNKSAKERLLIDTRLRYATSSAAFTLNYQPKYSCIEKQIKGLEALIRWQDPVLGFVPPDKFIPIAEESGYIYDIGLWVIKEALRALKVIHSI